MFILAAKAVPDFVITVMMTKTAIKTPGRSHHDGDDDQNSGENPGKESS